MSKHKYLCKAECPGYTKHEHYDHAHCLMVSMLNLNIKPDGLLGKRTREGESCWLSMLLTVIEMFISKPTAIQCMCVRKPEPEPHVFKIGDTVFRDIDDDVPRRTGRISGINHQEQACLVYENGTFCVAPLSKLKIIKPVMTPEPGDGEPLCEED